MSEPADPASYAVDGGARPLSGEALSTLLQDVLARRVPFRFEARGYSMIPFIRNGDVVTISPLPGRRARVGDVVAFAGPAHELVVHRVTARRAGAYEIRADNSGGLDRAVPDIVPETALLGVVTRVERGGRRVRLGLGPERVVIAALARLGWLQPLVTAARAARTSVSGSRML